MSKEFISLKPLTNEEITRLNYYLSLVRKRSTKTTTAGKHKRAMPQTKRRTTYDRLQLERLHQLYERNPYPSLQERFTLSDELNLKTCHVTVWFQNQRSRQKRESYKRAASAREATFKPEECSKDDCVKEKTIKHMKKDFVKEKPEDYMETTYNDRIKSNDQIVPTAYL